MASGAGDLVPDWTMGKPPSHPHLGGLRDSVTTAVTECGNVGILDPRLWIDAAIWRTSSSFNSFEAGSHKLSSFWARLRTGG